MKNTSFASLKVAVIDNPYECLSDREARDIWSKIMALKIAGYRSEYPYGVLPVDTSDFYSTHLAICREKNGELEPLIAYKSISLDAFDAFEKGEFLLVDHFRKSDAHQHVRAIRELIASCRESRRSFRYTCAYTIAPEARADRDLAAHLKELLCAIDLHYLQEAKIDVTTCAGVTKFKVDKMFSSWGYQRIRLAGAELPNYFPSCIFGGEAAFFVSGTFTEYARGLAERYRSLWDSRIHFRSREKSPERKAA